MQTQQRGGLREQARLVGCGLVAGSIAGMFLGWMLHGVIGWIVRIAIVLIFVIPTVAAIYFWMNSRDRGGSSGDIREASWRDVGGSGDRRP
jgi:hypothetical protein